MQRFGPKEGPLFRLDLGRLAGVETGRRSERLLYRERFGPCLRRQSSGWKLAERSAQANLEFSISLAFPRRFLRHGQHGGSPSAVLRLARWYRLDSSGLTICARERRLAISGLAIYVPAGRENAPALSLLCLDPGAAAFALFGYTPEDQVARADPRDHGNLGNRLKLCRRPFPEDDVGDPPWRENSVTPRRGGCFLNPAAEASACAVWS